MFGVKYYFFISYHIFVGKSTIFIFPRFAIFFDVYLKTNDNPKIVKLLLVYYFLFLVSFLYVCVKDLFD